MFRSHFAANTMLFHLHESHINRDYNRVPNNLTTAAMYDNQIRKIVIVGSGTAGWMAAASLAYFNRGKQVDILLIESGGIETIGVGEATIPGIRDFNASLGIDEIDFIINTQATFKLGIEFSDWLEIGDSFFHPFGGYGVDLNSVGFHRYMTKLRELGNKIDISDYSISTNLAKLKKSIIDTAERAMYHDEFIKRHCAANI